MTRVRYTATGIFDIDFEEHDPGPGAVAQIPSLEVGEEFALHLLASNSNALNQQLMVAVIPPLMQQISAMGGTPGRVRVAVGSGEGLSDDPDEWPEAPQRT